MHCQILEDLYMHEPCHEEDYLTYSVMFANVVPSAKIGAETSQSEQRNNEADFSVMELAKA